MEQIVRVHFDKMDDRLLHEVLVTFYAIRNLRGLQKKPSTSEVLDWLQALQIGGVDPSKIAKTVPYAGVLLKKNEDMAVLDQTLRTRGRI